MLICPECADSLSSASAACRGCGWEPFLDQGIPNFLTRQDRESEFDQSYAENYESLAQKNLENSNIDRRFLKNQAKNLMRYIGGVEDLDVCDIGIGQGFLCHELISSGVRSVVAVDVAPSYLAQLSNIDKVEPYLANAESLPFKDQFDLIASTDVMEHVVNVGSFLYCVNRALKIGGRAAIRVPYREGLLNYSRHKGYGHKFGHLRSFNKDILKIYMKQAGFRVISFHLDGYSLGTPHEYLYSTNRRKHWYHKFYNYHMKRLEHPADANLWNPRFAGLFMKPVEIVVIAEKVISVA